MDPASYLAQLLVNGLHNGALYALLAFGYVLTYSVTHRANIAHGAIFAFSGQVLVLTATFGYATLWMTLPAAIFFGTFSAILCSGLVLWMLARTVLPPFIAKAPNAMIVVTIAVSIILMEGVRISADARDYWLPPLLSWQIHLPFSAIPPSLTLLQCFNILIIIATLTIAHTILERTSMGRILRAVSDDKHVASLIGINIKIVTEFAIITGGALACLTGILAVLYFGNMSFGSGLVFGLKLLFITAAGGFTSPIRAAYAAFLFGEAEALWDGYLPIVWREPMFYSLLALVLCLRTENRVERI